MKASIAAILLLSLSSVKAATVGISPFFSGVPVYFNATEVPYSLSVGGYSGGVFTQFGSTIRTTGVLTGAFVGLEPTSLNNQNVFLQVEILGGSGTAILETQGQFGIVGSVANAPIIKVFNGSHLTFVESSGSFSSSLIGDRVVFVPEPSSLCLLGLSALSLLRRRR